MRFYRGLIMTAALTVASAANADHFQWSILTGTALGTTGSEFKFGLTDWDHDGIPDLVAIKKYYTGTSTTEVHILSGASNYTEFLVQTGTGLGLTDDNWDLQLADWDQDGIPDLIAVWKNNTWSGKTEVYVLSGASGFQSFILGSVTPLDTGGTDVREFFAD